MATYQLISSVTVGSGGASSIDFTSIPATYTDLVVKFSGRANNAAATAVNCSFSFNSSTSNFSQRGLSGSGSSASSYSRTDNLNMIVVPGAGATTSTFGSAEIYLPNYAGSTNKSFSTDDVTENNASEAYAQLHAGLWSNTAAISSISIAPQGSGSWVQYSTAYLYGIKSS